MILLKEIRRRNLPITRSAFIAGEKSFIYLDAFYVDLFLTTNEDENQDFPLPEGVYANFLKNYQQSKQGYQVESSTHQLN